jgi:hypothetical protein
MLSILYVSSARRMFSADDLKALLKKSRDNNAGLGLTGLYAKIERDPTHCGILQLVRKQIEAREFASWSMGFNDLKDVDLAQMPGYTPLLNQPLNSAAFQADPTRAQKLLRMFGEKM